MEGTERFANLIRVARTAYRLRLTPGATGNLSERTEGTVWISATGVSLGFIGPEDFVAAGDDPSAALKRVSSETPMHLAVYRAVPEAGAILHFHGPWTLQAGRGGGTDRWIPTTAPPEFAFIAPRGSLERVPFLEPGSESLAQAVAVAFSDGARAAILCGHGGVAWGRDPVDALMVAEGMEAAAHLDYHARLLRLAREGSGL